MRFGDFISALLGILRARSSGVCIRDGMFSNSSIAQEGHAQYLPTLCLPRRITGHDYCCSWCKTRGARGQSTTENSQPTGAAYQVTIAILDQGRKLVSGEEPVNGKLPGGCWPSAVRYGALVFKKFR